MNNTTMQAIRENKLTITDIKTTDGKNIRVIYNEIDGSVRMIVDQSILSKCKQVDFTPYIEVSGFYND